MLKWGFEKCNPITSFWITNKNGVFIKTTPTYNVYVNEVNGKYKLYGPEKRLFLTNFGKKEIGGLIPYKDYDTIIITMNLKSYLVISNLGYNCRYVPSESTLFPKFFIEELRQFKRIILFMDFDEGGVRYTNRLMKVHHQLPLEAIFFSLEETYIDCFGNEKNCSDAFDIAFKHGVEYFKQFLNNIIWKRNLK